jgi:FkbM family methyltransferase
MSRFLSNKYKDYIYKTISEWGYSFTPYAYSSNLEFSHHLRELFPVFGITCVFDVGANTGQYRNFLRRRCGYEGLIVSIEPARSTFEALERNAEHDKTCLTLNCALGSHNEERELNIMRDTHFNSFLKPQQTDICKSDIQNVVERVETVTVRRLDSLIKELAKQHDLSRVYLKIDTQGHDLEVLKGAGEEINNVMALQTEISVKPLYSGMPTLLESITELSKLGFELTGLFPVTRDIFHRVIEFDCVAVNHAQVIKLASTRI